jgi:hypothetical protein
MTKNLETADTIVKLTLAVTVLVFDFTNIIAGPFANALMILAIVVIVIFLARLFYARMFTD